MSDADGLRVFLLGPPYLEWHCKPFNIPRRQVRALLFRLSAELVPVSRDYLCYLLWPDQSQAKARRRLSHLQTHLRSALPADDLLIVSDDHLALNTDHVWSDVATLEGLFNSADPENRLESLDTARCLYGGTFLDGFAMPDTPVFEAWIREQQHIQERRYLWLLNILIERSALRRDYEKAIVLCHAYLEINELAEDVHRRLVEFYGLKGEIKSAQAQYQLCVDLLNTELAVSPRPETTNAFETVQRGRRSLSPTTNRLGEKMVSEHHAIPLIGRESDLDKLWMLFNQAQRGGGNVGFITGESGIGKSRLMSAFVDGLAESVLVVRSYCYAGTQSVPYFPLLDAVPWWNMATDAYQDPVTRVLAEAYRSQPRPNLTYLLRLEELRVHIYEALYQILLGRASEQTTVLCIEDLQWADETTMDWLAFVGHRIGTQKVLMLASFCCSPPDNIQSLQYKFHHMNVPVEHIVLDRLHRDDVRKLFRILIDSDTLLDRLVDAIWQLTGGNPFYVLELWRGLEDNNYEINDLAAISPEICIGTLEQAINLRLAGLSSVARQMLDVVAILASPCSFDEVYRVSGRTEMTVVEALEELVSRYLLEGHGINYQFRHVATREVVLKKLNSIRYELLRRRANALGLEFGDSIAARRLPAWQR